MEKNREKEAAKMEVLSIKRNKMTLELTPRELTLLVIAGLRLELAEMGCTHVVVSCEEADAMGLKLKKGAKRIELTDEECRMLVEKAVTTALRKKIEEEEAKRKAQKKAKRKK